MENFLINWILFCLAFSMTLLCFSALFFIWKEIIKPSLMGK